MPVISSRIIEFSAASGTAVSTATPWIPLNIHETPFNVGFGVVKGGNGSCRFSVQHTFDNVLDASVTPTVFTHADVCSKTASIDGNYAYPVRAVRVAAVTVSSSCNLTLKVIQAG